MKYLDYPELEAVSRALTFESTECKVFTRLEAYSCKAVAKERRLFKALESAWQQNASTSPPDYLEDSVASPFGRLDQPNARKTLFLLISLLNGVFPDHDFSHVNPSDFQKEVSPAAVLHSLSSTLDGLRNNRDGPRSYSTFTESFGEHAQRESARGSAGLRPGSHPSSSYGSSGGSPQFSRLAGLMGGAVHAGLASLLDDIMDIRDCDVYTFHPDMDSDPHACPEPDEQGGHFGEDGEYWNEDGDEEMQSVNVVTPRRLSSAAEFDAPFFDEDMDGGFSKGAPAQASQRGSSFHDWGGRRPQTPTDEFSASGRKGHLNSRLQEPIMSSSLSSASSVDLTDDDDDDLDGIGGLLWSTYAFFYNRKLKRILFVTVWSRINHASGNSWTSPLTSYHEPAASAPTSMRLPASVAPVREARQMTPGGTLPTNIASTATSSKERPSPAKLALTRGRRLRGASGSPAPSSMSPFPHASPRGSQGEGSQTRGMARSTRSAVHNAANAGGPDDGTGSMSLDAAALSISAPAATATSTAGALSSSSVSSSSTKRSANNGEVAGGRKLRRQVAAT